MNCGGIVLCGGRSSRMGVSKAALPFGDETMLARVVRLMREATDPVVVVGSREQQLPELPVGPLVVTDRRAGCGPLEAVATGLRLLAGKVEIAFVTACDAPLLRAGFVHRLVELLEDHDAVVPWTQEGHHLLSAVYRVDVASYVERVLILGERSMSALLRELDVRVVLSANLMDVDPELHSLANLNEPPAYFAALETAGLAPPPDILARFSQ